MAYNGWTNYATWRVNLEMFDGIDPAEYADAEDIREIADSLESLATDIIEQEASGLALDYAMAFLSDVNWYEIADHIAQDGELFDYAPEEEEE